MSAGHRVLLLYSESRLTSSVIGADQAFRSTLEARLSGSVHFDTEFLDLNSLHGASLGRGLRALLHLKYKERPIDVIVAQGELSVPFTLQNRAELFSSAPVVFLAVERSTFADPSVDPVVTGTWRRRGWAETLDLARRLHPGTRRAVVMVGSSRAERFWIEAARQQLATYAESIEISYLVDEPFEDMLRVAAGLPRGTVVLVGPFLRDGTGRDFATPAAIGHIAAVAGVPVYGVTDASIGTGAVGGHVLSFAAHGEVAAELAVRVLSGDRPSPTADGTTFTVLDDRQITRWGIDRRRLPPGSVILFREPSRWERYRGYVATALGVPFGRRVQRSPDDRVQFEGLLSDLSTALLSCPAAEIDRQIGLGIRRIVEYLKLDCATIWALDDGAREARLAHSWAREGVPPPPPAISEREAPQILSRLRQGDVVRIPPLGGPPAEAVMDGQPIARFGARSIAAVPIFEGGSVAGAFCAGRVLPDHDWPDELIARLRLLADVFANALARQRAERVVRESAEHIRYLAGRLMIAQEEERRRIARELHDGVNQDLAALAIALSALEGALPEGTAPEQREKIAGLQGRVMALAEAIRLMSHDLHPGILQYGGLAAALRSHCRDFEREHGLAVIVRTADDLGAVPPDVALCLYRVTQEALKNAAKHAAPKHVWLAAAREGADLVLTISDDGCGFDLSEARGRGGLGLISIDERVRLAGGRLTIDTGPQRGTEVQVVVPLAEARDAPPDHPAR